MKTDMFDVVTIQLVTVPLDAGEIILTHKPAVGFKQPRWPVMCGLEFMDRAVGVREPLNVTVLNQIKVKYDELLIVLFGNPFIDAVESEEEKKWFWGILL